MPTGDFYPDNGKTFEAANSPPRCAVTTGSAADTDARQIAITGYMADRNDLIHQMGNLNLYYERDKEKRAVIQQELERIDVAVAALLPPNGSDEPRGI